MRSITKLVMAVAMIGASAYAGAQAVVYDVSNFQLGNGDYLSGTIDLSNSASAAGGNLSSSSITSVSVGLYSSTGLIEQYSAAKCGFGCGLDLSAGKITIDPFNFLNFVSFAKSGCCGATIKGGAYDSYIIPSSGWPQFLSTDLTGSVFATAAPQSAPEIDSASAASGVALLLGGLAVLFGRRPRALSA